MTRLGIAGGIEAPAGGDLSHVSVNNVGGNKLDVYVDRTVSVEAVVGPAEAVVTQRVVFENRAPTGLVPYVAGVERPGTVISRVELSLPAQARDISASLDGGTWTGRVDRGATRYRLPVRVDTPRGQASTLLVRYRLSVEDGAYDVRLIPQPLASDARVQVSASAQEGFRLVGDDAQDGVLRYDGPLDRTLDLSVRAVPEP